MTILQNVEKLTFVGRTTLHRDYRVTVRERIYTRCPSDADFATEICKAIPAEYAPTKIEKGSSSGGGSAGAGGWSTGAVRLTFATRDQAKAVAKAFKDIGQLG